MDYTEFDKKLRDLATRYTNASLGFLQEQWDKASTRPNFIERISGEESKWFGPDTLHVGRDSNTGARFLADEEGLVLTREEFEELSEIVSEVYEFYTDEDIQRSNAMARQRNFVEWVELNGRGSERGRPKPIRRTSPGYVYIIKGNDVYKIGRSKKLEQRLTYFELKLPFPIEVVHTIYSKDYAGLERKLHDLYDSKRINGEWFELTLEDVEYIKSIRSDRQESS